ncbi:MFS family permease [Hamadaea flava]|uniref:MFS transporter n=1 Tax=Hamadaea flava TaxID=1742688 RepID=A0ABV8M276_9ACTN|nr:MFS transporter [Hamadaea flava]MCP2326850.1 MFS family permease [Hamadaea flava]
MSLTPYRHVLALPGVRPILLLGLIARIPMTAIGISFTLHTVLTLHHSYGAAGLVTTVYTIAAAVSSPLMGRMLDRGGVRRVMAITGGAQLVIWLFAPTLGYAGLLVAAAFAGLFAIPIFGLVRQSISALVPDDQRRPAFALDSMGVELSFMVGPAVAVAGATALSSTLTMYVLGAAMVLAAVGVYWLNPPMRSEAEEAAAEQVRIPRRQWLRGPVLAVLATATGMTVILSGTDMAVVGILREADATSSTGLVIALWCAYSLLGALIYGALHRPFSPLALVAVMGLLTIPIGLSPNWLWLCVLLIPAGLLCAPSITAGNEAITRLVPATSRGEAMGLQGSAMTAGVSLGAPFAGFVVDFAGPGWAFAAVGAAGILVVLASLPLYRRPTPALEPLATPDTAGEPVTVSQVTEPVTEPASAYSS